MKHGQDKERASSKECKHSGVLCSVREKLISANDYLSKINGDLEQFIRLMSHDLKAPLYNIVGFANVLKESCWDKLSKEEKTYLVFISESAERLSDLMDDLLEYSKVSIKMQRENVFLDSVCEDILKRLSFPIKASGAEVTIDPLPMVFCNKTHIGQVFQNLIDNSIKYRHQSRVCKIHIGCYGGENEYCFYIEDNGIGIPESYKEKQSNVFGAFKRVIEYNDYEGNGIGLAICKKIIENHGGDIWFESEHGKGTVFYFTLPLGKLPPSPEIDHTES